ncbi:MAG: Asp-tRNA(Asn)/Glu-tRNA(Gln) amidotransferase subunit GatB [Nitrospirae bacterium]|nr:Asp-tRNA(Asn)/Glu-tRNA(Gln) amidotransferase subunit GatB [Nitrospirota bacterium]
MFETVIGLEVHAQLKTRTKLFCGCSTRFGDSPNSNVCPVCLGMPGVLPVINREAVRLAMKAATAAGCRVHPESIMARKNYFYPDLPKAYQISQYESPLATGGHVDVREKAGMKKVGLVRMHMEEDAGKLVHERNASLVDFNRCGVPLVEIVSEPEMRSSEEAAEYLKNLRNILRYTGVCDGNMEEGSLRCDANISIRREGDSKLGTKVEIKNMNSFRNVQLALEYERQRQAKALEQGERIVQETRLWDAEAAETRPMRSKEEAHDYRYFPDPDLLPIRIPEAWLGEVRSQIPELPLEKLRRYVETLGLPAADAETLIDDLDLVEFFEKAVAVHPQAKTVSNWLSVELVGMLRKHNRPIVGGPVTPASLSELLKAIESGTVSGKMGKEILEEMVVSGQRAPTIIEKRGLKQITNEGDIETVVAAVVAKFPKEAERVRSGETKLLQFFVGQAMKETKGKANPALLQRIVARKFSEG